MADFCDDVAAGLCTWIPRDGFVERFRVAEGAADDDHRARMSGAVAVAGRTLTG